MHRELQLHLNFATRKGVQKLGNAQRWGAEARVQEKIAPTQLLRAKTNEPLPAAAAVAMVIPPTSGGTNFRRNQRASNHSPPGTRSPVATGTPRLEAGLAGRRGWGDPACEAAAAGTRGPPTCKDDSPALGEGKGLTTLTWRSW